MLSFRFNVLVTILITLVSLCSARTVITIEKCSTRFCGSPVKVYRTTKTVCARTPYTVTRWKTSIVPAATKTETANSYFYVTKTATLSIVTSLKTVWIGTSTHTRKFTTTGPSFIATAPITTRTITPSTVPAPTPSGIFGINQDPDNKAAQTLGKRNAEPEPAAVTKYASAVTCTKTLLTKTGTSDLWKTTTKKSGTKTVVVPLSTITLTVWTTGKGAKTIVSTTSMKKVAFASSTTTIYTPATYYQTTVTTTLPTPTYYQQCGYRNRAPPPEMQSRYWVAIVLDYPFDEPGIVTEGTMNAYDCCVSCWTLPASKGKCLGSIWSYTGPWGPPPCDWRDEENCNWPDQPPGTPNAICRLILEGKKGECKKKDFILYGSSSESPSVISNGPGCLKFKFAGTSFPWP
ncbi:hypothetical protein TWF730_001206 [Orbilia blumenaviensis]|uniref:Uncharacterized protein n=1 Tax=Orbilia blumenaviensis TaxID=1796055 RepID=A0AAV9VV25_9PEZI